MPESLFSRAVHYAESSSADPAENRLTEITGAVLERHQPLAREFTKALLAQAGEKARPAVQPRIAAAVAWLATHGDRAEVMVRTQLPRGSRFVDLELRLASDPLRRARDLVVWVEVKLDADISGDQLSAYLNLIEREPGDVRTLIVLASRKRPPSPNLVPEAVPVAFWQQVIRAVTRLPLDPPGSANALLTQELLNYFEEKELMPVQPLTTESALSLANRDATRETVRAMREIVRERVRDHYDQTLVGGSYSSKGFWTHNTITPESPAWGDAWLEWGFRKDMRPEARGAYAFVAGVTFPKKADIAGEERHQEWLVARLNQGFEHETYDGWPRVWSYRYPEQLLVASTFEEQADLLAGWVLERFDTLTAIPPT